MFIVVVLVPEKRACGQGGRNCVSIYLAHTGARRPALAT